MTDKKHNSLVFWIKCVDALGILILVSPWVAMVLYNLVFWNFMGIVELL